MPAETATVVDARSGETVLTDGPYLETKEHIGGFWIIDVADLDAALTWAAKGSVPCHGTVEVRPFQSDAPAPTEPARGLGARVHRRLPHRPRRDGSITLTGDEPVVSK